MSLDVVISDASGTRVLGEQDLPLNIGTASESAVRIPGAVTPGYIAQVGMLDERPFVQSSGNREIQLNGSVVSGTSWLHDGDELQVGGVRITCAVSPDKLELTVNYRDVEYETTPPILTNDAADPAPTITPVRPRKSTLPSTASVQSNRARNWGYGGFGLLGIAALYLFTAVTVVIEADQEGASVSLPGSWLTPGGDGRYLLWPGEYEVLIEEAGYQPLRAPIEVESGGRAEFNFNLAELPGRIVVVTNPESPGEVWIGDQQVGTLPGPAILLDKGSYELRIRVPRFLEYISIIEVAGRDELQEIAVDLVPGWADVTVISDPIGASIFSADELLGETPATVELLAGNQQIELRKTGYKSVQSMLNVIAGQPEELPLIALQESGGVLEITSTPSGAAVTIGKQFIGNTPLQYEAAKGRDYRVKLSMAGYETASRTVDVLDGTGVRLNVKLKPKMGTINISATPADASLYVDGKLVGSASQEIELIAVPHLLEVRKSGFAAWSARVTPKPGLPQSIDVRLLTPQQAVVAAIPKTVKTNQDQVLLLIEPGSFTMGAPRREQGRRPNEVRKDVQLTRRFYVGVQEVTNREFREFSPRHTSGAEKYRELAADEHPAVMVSWEEAAAYCNWLSDRDGLDRAYVKAGGRFTLADPVTDGYRLPTEAEWVWVARFMGGGGELKYPWGSGMPPPADAGNYADATAIDVASNTISSYSDGYPVTAPAGSFPPNSIGLYDLGGNVAEWVNDRYSVSASNGGRLIDPVGPSDGQYHVIRGSSWRQSSISELRLAYRDFGDRGRLDVGFRIARYTSQPN